MSIVRTAEQTKLAELQAIGKGMLIRYGELMHQGDKDLSERIELILSQRRPLLDAVATAQESRGEFPEAGDREVNELHAFVDRILAALLGQDSLKKRVQRAEESWRSTLDDAMHLDWHQRERQALQALVEDNARALQALEEIRS